MFELKKLSKKAVMAALKKANHYRYLNEPEQAESICLDVLEIEPDNQETLITLLLALSDQFKESLQRTFKAANDVLPQLTDEYHQIYYHGIVCERRARAHFRQGGPSCGYIAHDWYRRAMESYEKAAGLSPEGNEDAILRWNSCVRTLNSHPELKSEPQPDMVQPFLE